MAHSSDMGQVSVPRGRIVGVSLFVSCALVGFSWLLYRDMTREIPPFEQLEVIESSGLSSRSIKSKNTDQFQFEMTTEGRRLFTNYMDRDAAEKIQTALTSGRALVYAGPWESPFPSEDIRSVFHIELDGEPLLDYRDLVSKREKSQRHAWIAVIIFNALVIAVVAWAILRPPSVNFLLKLVKVTRLAGG